MKVNTIVRAAGEIVRVAELRSGDVYKRLQKKYTDEYVMRFGYVTDVMMNGETAVLVAVEFTPPEYGSGTVAPEIKTFHGDADLMLYPATPEEYMTSIDAAIAVQVREVEKSEQELATKRSVLDRMRAVTSALALSTAANSSHVIVSTITPDVG